MKKVFLLSIAASVFSLTGCDSEDEPSSSEDRLITINPTIGQMSRVTTSENGSQTFTKDDAISVYAWTGDKAEPIASELVVNNSINTFDGTTWSANPMMMWLDDTTKHYFLGVYPTRSITNFTADPYTLNPENQSVSDLLVAVNTTGLTASTNPVNLEFNHVMAKLVVNLSFRSNFKTAPTVTSVSANAQKTAIVNYLTNGATTVTASGNATTITLPEVKANATYSSIMIPESGLKSINILIDGTTFTYTGDIALTSGKYTTVNLVVGRDEVILGNVTINDWDEGSNIDGEAL